MTGTERDDQGQQRGGGLWDAVDDIEHVVGQTEPATQSNIPPVRSAPPPPDESPESLVDGTPVPEADDSPEAGPSPRLTRGRVLAVVALLLLAVAAIVVLTATRPTGPVTLPLPSGLSPPGGGTAGLGGAPAPSGPGVAPANPSTAPSRSANPSNDPSASPPVSPPPTTPEPVPLTARYATLRQNVLGLSGYTGQVRVSNPGGGAVSGWQVVITFPNGARVADTSGAQAEQRQNTVTFTPTDSTRDVGGGATVEFTFDVTGLMAGQPTGCAIDGRPCD